MPTIYFEDFSPGTVTTFGARRVDQEEIIAFAREFDPQPMHVDPEAAKESFLGTLIGSGWHSCALLMRMAADDFILDAASMGSPGIEEVRWLKPLKPGDRLSVRRTILEARASESRPQMGLVRFRFDLMNGGEDPLMTQTNWIMFGRRGAAPSYPPSGRGPMQAAASMPAAASEPQDIGPTPFLEDLAPGNVTDLGAYHFTAEEIVRFAQAFDPQPFHTDAEAARESHFGALCASGWHTAAVWMKLMAGHAERQMRAAAATGRPSARLGPSPGFSDLKWSKPVYAGDTLRYRTEIVSARPSLTRPQWGIVTHHNTAENQRGERVFEFTGRAFWERRS
ncbi:MaoC family dehydratase [Chelatococcus sp. SYSU_G07232]|uniref:MaoC family dehydratase n=1 Tax=Chelatococcus albus TaxID=3047466 RepID=A0ABT7AIW5_9HYPH|nr:MaoC family dehydratase [Chelatococcus sp. SYSU_G07232]MDJ1159314.1 MaoC family dehydratase [Chelatococcus sp. SYSU_G07232]